MGTISYTVPVAGTDLNSVADPEIATALTTLLTFANGNVDVVNLSATAQTALKASGAWQSLSLASGTTAAAGYTPAARTEGDVGRLTGSLAISTFSSGATLATIASSVRPTSAVSFYSGASGGAGTVAISTGGLITLTSSTGGGSPVTLSLEGISYRLS